jgi:hypothetical protein
VVVVRPEPVKPPPAVTVAPEPEKPAKAQDRPDLADAAVAKAKP